MNVELSGWTQRGDTVPGNGRWVIYRHRGKSLEEVQEEYTFGEDEYQKALKMFRKRSELRTGGVWLVSPNGVVVDLVFNR